jgi:hypothetical protein
MSEEEYKQVIGGEPVIKEVGYKIVEICCDCGLAHAVFYNVDVRRHKRVVVKTSYRDDYETVLARKRNESNNSR